MVAGESRVSRPLVSTTVAPNDHSRGYRMEFASSHWLMGIPTGWSAFFSLTAARRSSSHVAGGFSPTCFR